MPCIDVSFVVARALTKGNVMDKKSLIFYLLYTVFAFLFFLAMLFPGKAVAPALSRKINEHLFRDAVAIDDARLTYLRPGIALTPIHLSLSPKSDPLQIERLSIFPNLLTLLSSRKSLGLKAKLYNGTATGEVLLNYPSPFFNASPDTLSLTIDFKEIAIKEMTHKMEGITLNFTFDLKGHVSYTQGLATGKGHQKSVTGEMEADHEKQQQRDDAFGASQLTLTHATFQTTDPIMKQMKLTTLNFSTIEADLTLENDYLHVRQLNGVGSELNLALKGSILLRTPMTQSVLNLEGEVMPKASHLASLSAVAAVSMLFGNSAKGVPFKLKGTVSKPKLSF